MLLLSRLLVLLSFWQAAQSAAPDLSKILWDKTIPYVIDLNYSDKLKEEIREALKTFDANTCLKYKEDYGPGLKLEYKLVEKGCEGEVGRSSNWNTTVSLEAGCTHKTAIQHETMHTLGFRHTQARFDRDDYVTVSEEYKLKRNYLKVTTPNNYGIPYEYHSLLHSSASINMQPKDRDYVNSMWGTRMTFNDWKVINMHYKCNETCAPETKCYNGGYQHPNDCNKCVCPHFFKGAHCEESRHPINLTPGQITPLNYGWVFNQTAKDAEIDDEDFFDKSPAHVIKAPEGTKIRITIININDPYSKKDTNPDKRCNNYGLEVVDADLTMVGKRFCSITRNGYSFLSKTNVIGFYAYSIPGWGFFGNATFAVEGAPVEPVTTTTLAPTTQSPITTTTTIKPTTTLTTTTVIPTTTVTTSVGPTTTTPAPPITTYPTVTTTSAKPADDVCEY